MHKANQYYNDNRNKWLRDFCKGNPRIKNAIQYACEKLLEYQCIDIIDLGCGIGWSSYEYARHITDANITAIDFSEGLLEIGRNLFESDRIEFRKLDITSNNWLSDNKYDACVMLDVYEHVSVDKRDDFNKALHNLLKEDGIVVLTCPTYLHQLYLRENKPEGLQPVDEDITLDTLEDLANILNGQVVDFSYNNVFATNDYFCATIQRNCKRKEITRTHYPTVKLLTPGKRLRLTSNLDSVISKEELDKAREPLRIKARLKKFAKKIIQKIQNNTFGRFIPAKYLRHYGRKVMKFLE